MDEMNTVKRPMFTMLTTAVESRFANGVRVPVDAVNEGAIFIVKAITPRKLKEWGAKFNICSTCGGRGLNRDDAGVLHTCVRCGGKYKKTWLDPDVRSSMFADICVGWENVFMTNPETGEILPLMYTEEVRETLSDTGVFDALFDEAVKLATRIKEEQEKN